MELWMDDMDGWTTMDGIDYGWMDGKKIEFGFWNGGARGTVWTTIYGSLTLNLCANN